MKTLKLYESNETQKNDVLNLSLTEIESSSYRHYEKNKFKNLLTYPEIQ